MKRGEVWQVELPPLPFEQGHEQKGERPAVILTPENVSNLNGMVVVVPFTSTLKAQDYAGTVRVDKSPGNGLENDSVALCLQVRALGKKRILARLGDLSPADLAEVVRTVGIMIGTVLPRERGGDA